MPRIVAVWGLLEFSVWVACSRVVCCLFAVLGCPAAAGGLVFGGGFGSGVRCGGELAGSGDARAAADERRRPRGPGAAGRSGRGGPQARARGGGPDADVDVARADAPDLREAADAGRLFSAAAAGQSRVHPAEQTQLVKIFVFVAWLGHAGASAGCGVCRPDRNCSTAPRTRSHSSSSNGTACSRRSPRKLSISVALRSPKMAMYACTCTLS